MTRSDPRLLLSARCCPVTGLPVTAPEQWQNLPAGDCFTVSFAIIGERILLSLPAGELAQADSERFLSHRQRILSDRFGENPPPLIEIRDHGLAFGVFSRENRPKERETLIQAARTGLTLIVCNATPAMTALYRTLAHGGAQGLILLPAEHYDQAITLALKPIAGESEAYTGSLAGLAAVDPLVADFSPLLRQFAELAMNESPTQDRPPSLPAESTLRPLEEALALVREDMRTLLREAREREQSLADARERLEHEAGQRNMAERQVLEAMSMARAANAAKGEFLANISHEVRTPMNGIIGLTELLLSGDLPAEQRRYMDMIKGSAGRLLTLLNDILDYSKIETGKLEIVPIAFNFRDMVANALAPLQKRARDKGLDFTLTLDPDMPVNLIGDPGRLRQVLNNLITNAIKFTERGSVTVRIAPAAPGNPPGLSRPVGDAGLCILHCRVEDTGIGIPGDKEEGIFEAFRQGDGSATRKYGGVGLGLAIARQIVELMGGTLWAETPARGGAIFHFTAQLRVQPGSATEPGLVPLRNLQGVSLLIVENNPMDRFVMREMMQRWFRVIETVESGKSLRSILEQHPFDLVLLDKELPDLGAFDAARLLSRLSTPPRLILITSRGERGDARLCRETGIEGYLMKPITHADLLRAIRAILARPAPGGGTELPLVTRHYLRETSRQVHVLLAENDYMSQVLSTAQLEGQGWRVTPATGGREVLELIGQEDFSFLILDIRLAEMDGFALVAKAREREKESDRRSVLIGIGSQEREEVIKDCLAGGFDGYAQRPLSVERLREEVGRLVDGL